MNHDRPKVFVPILRDKTIFDFLYSLVSPHCDGINLVLSPEGNNYKNLIPVDRRIEISIQDDPIGMGDAIFKGYEFWSKFDYVYIIWGDQVNVSQDTMSLMTTYAQKKRPVIPLTRQPDPYVEYEFDDSNSLFNIKQSRRGINVAAVDLVILVCLGCPLSHLKHIGMNICKILKWEIKQMK